MINDTENNAPNRGDVSDSTDGFVRPLFIPLKTRYYEDFENGDKKEELRLYGPRWNERTCKVGRKVVLSKGYGKAHRIDGEIFSFKRQHGSTFGQGYQNAIMDCFGTLDVWVACIGIETGVWADYDCTECDNTF